MTARDRWILAALVIATLTVYAQTARFGFVEFDDPEYVFRNHRTLQGLTPGNVYWAWTTFAMSNWHPLTWLSYMLDVQLFGAWPGALPGAMHLVNVLLHSANTALLFLLLRSMTASSWRSALVAALFALHPLHVESVAWIAERKDVLSTLFGLASIAAYVRYTRAGGTLTYLTVIGLFVLSLLAKPMLVTLPFLLWLLDYWPLQRLHTTRISRIILEKVPLLALSAMSSVITWIAQYSGGAVRPLGTVSLGMRVGNAAVSYLQYIADMFVPARLSFFYPLSRELTVQSAVLAGATLVGLSLLVLVFARGRSYLPVGWFWYLGTLTPVIGLVSVGEQARADRYTYFPLIGLFILMAWSIPCPRNRAQQRVLVATVAALLLALSVQCWRQVRLWRDSETLFRHATAIVGQHPLIEINWGMAMSAQQRYAEAAEHYREALRLRPNWALAIGNLGVLRTRAGDFDEALRLFQQALELDPNHAMTHYNLGVLYAKLQRYAEAEQRFREALRLHPDFPPARHNLNEALKLQGKSN